MKRRVGLTVVSLLVVAAVAVGLLWAFPILRVSQVEVRGANNLPAEQVQEATGIQEGENMLRVDVAAAATAVAESPWVRTVTVSRSWPDTITVELAERDAVLFQNEADGAHLIDPDGTTFAVGEPPPEAVEVTGGAADDREALADVAEVVASVPPDLRAQVERVEVPSAAEITFVMGDGRTVYWGANEENHDKALAMATVLGREGQEWNISNPAMVTVG